ncbi:39S ribosomal protein L33, mitochondrial [Quaeritorhiza haematococci]|nr:39S ribosomal protein L33, mitochondrial [Quaeritorhiza haematococci]
MFPRLASSAPSLAATISPPSAGGLLLRRCICSTTVTHARSIPKRKTYTPPTLDALKEITVPKPSPSTSTITTDQPGPKKIHLNPPPPNPDNKLPLRARFRRPPKAQRHLPDTQTAIPLPTTFPPGMDIYSFRRSHQARIPSTPLTTDPNYYPYRYYEITLRKGVVGLSKDTKELCLGLGLRKRNQTVYHLVSETIAGKILKIKELVAVRLVNEIPKKVEIPAGYKKVGNAIGTALEGGVRVVGPSS